MVANGHGPEEIARVSGTAIDRLKWGDFFPFAPFRPIGNSGFSNIDGRRGIGLAFLAAIGVHVFNHLIGMRIEIHESQFEALQLRVTELSGDELQTLDDRIGTTSTNWKSQWVPRITSERSDAQLPTTIAILDHSQRIAKGIGRLLQLVGIIEMRLRNN